MIDHDIALIANWIGTISFALSGILVAMRKELDLLGVGMIAMITACGGGVIRDVLVNNVPLLLKDSKPLFVVMIMLIIARVMRWPNKSSLEQQGWFVCSDAIGLVAFSISGALVAIHAELKILGIMLLAFITATGGGLIRDMLVNDVPLIFKAEFYGTIALLSGLMIYILNKLHMINIWSIAAVTAAMLSLRLLAYYRHWQLPKLHSLDLDK
jgi:uncharacterized membrane protein YeiH